MPIEEVGLGFVGLEPVAVQQEAMDLVGEDKLFEWDALLSERASE